MDAVIGMPLEGNKAGVHRVRVDSAMSQQATSVRSDPPGIETQSFLLEATRIL